MSTPTKDKSPLTIAENSINVESEASVQTKAPQTETLEVTTKISSVKIENVATNEDQRLIASATHTSNTRGNRSGIAGRRTGPPLVRSQTARNLSSHLNNQTTVGITANQLNGNSATSGNNAATSKKESKREIDKDREQGE